MADSPITREVERRLEVERQLVAAKEVAAFCSVSKATWARWYAADRVPAPVKIGRTVRWRLADLERWVALGCPPRKQFEALTKGA